MYTYIHIDMRETYRIPLIHILYYIYTYTVLHLYILTYIHMCIHETYRNMSCVKLVEITS